MMAECRGGDCLIKLFGKTIPVPEANKDLQHSGCSSSSTESNAAQENTHQEASDQSSLRPEVVDAEDPNKSSPETTQQPGADDDAASLREKLKKPDKVLPCPRCNSMDTMFCYFNNYNVNQPRHFCKNCQRYWTAGGAMRNVPVGAGRRKNKHAVAASHFFQRVRAVLPDASDQLKTNGTVLSFGHDHLAEQVSHHLKDKLLVLVRNGDNTSLAGPCGEGSSNNCREDHSTHGGGIMEKSTVENPANGGVQRPASMNGATVWPYSCAPSPAAPYFSSGIAIPIYPATPGYWGCMVPGAWSLPWPVQPPLPGLLSPTSAPSVSSSGPELESLKLGKHPRDREGDEGRSSHGSGKVWAPKTIRIDDADEVARSLIWSLIKIKGDKKQEADHAGGHRVGTVFEPKHDAKKMAKEELMLRLSNALPRRAGESRRHRPMAPATSVPVRSDTPPVPPSLGSVLLAGAGLAMDARGVSVGETVTEGEDLEEGEIPATGEPGGGGGSASRFASNSLPLQGLGQNSSSPAVGGPKASEENSASPAQSTCSTSGRSERDDTQEAGEEDADPAIGGQSKDGIVEIASCNVSVSLDLASSFELREPTWSQLACSGDAGSRSPPCASFRLAKELVCDQVRIDGGTDCGSRWLEQGNRTEIDDLSSPHAESGVLAEQPVHLANHLGYPAGNVNLSMRAEPNHMDPRQQSSRERKMEKAQRMVFGKPFPRRACMIRPWRGPLPRPRLATQLTLEAFLPSTHSWAHKSNSSRDSMVIASEKAPGAAYTEMVCALPLGKGQLNSYGRGSREIASIPDNATLIKKAKAFGRSRSCLIRHNQGTAGGKFSTLKEIDVTGVHHSVRSPSYAEMAARLPPPNQRAGDAAHRPSAPNNRNAVMAAPKQGDGWRG